MGSFGEKQMLLNKGGHPATVAEIFGENVFSLKTMRNYLSENAFASLKQAMKERKVLDPNIADEVADAMKTWAISKGAAYFSHWFQPLNGVTAEKHNSFLTPDGDGEMILQFSGKELTRGEPDASSFPSGGLRTTFEACGYTAWDPTSPAFIQVGCKGATLCIPSVFCSYHGEALDKKTGVLRSMFALSKQVCRLASLLNINMSQQAHVMMGFEQEYFLIDKKHYLSRPDLLQTGRTLFGVTPAKHQQMADHYFGAIKSRVMNFMEELDDELWRLGIPVKTRHNEVCPAQYEIATVYEELNLSVDHNMLIMSSLQKIAERHDLVCLLHEKPYAGVNGSGKHNNWSILGPDGKNWLSPGESPQDNAKFLTIICALIKGIDTYSELLRFMVASVSNDLRLGAQEAPPAILSIFLGDYLQEVIENLEKGIKQDAPVHQFIELGVSSLFPLPKDLTDRNRTSPFVFTGNKFEFRALGSSQSCAGANMVLNTIVADALDEICTSLEAEIAKEKPLNQALQETLARVIKEHKKVLYTGDNYSEEWLLEAEKRKLPNLKTTLDTIEHLQKEEIIMLFKKHGVLTQEEWKARCLIAKEQYEEKILIEGKCSLMIARTMILPAALSHQSCLAETIKNVEGCNYHLEETQNVLDLVSSLIERAFHELADLQEALEKEHAPFILSTMDTVRKTVDSLERVVPKALWPLPSYTEMLFDI